MSTRKHRRTWIEWLQIVALQGSFVLAVIFGVAREGHAHGGGLDSNGCHTNRKTGDYHCHRGPAAQAAPVQPASVATSSAAARLSPSRTSPSSRAFANCAEARAAGRAPVRRGEPGYGPHLDRDNDGIGCEPYRGR